ncbi:MAG: transposase [Planctomycetes bacterium]|nr:transposase [Planctomycetota bacterium]
MDGSPQHSASVSNLERLGDPTLAGRFRTPLRSALAPPASRSTPPCAYPRERLRRERLARCVLRPPFAAEQLSLSPEGDFVFRLARPIADGTPALRFEPSAFLERLVALVPRQGRPMLTYPGIRPPAASWRNHVVPASPPPSCVENLPPGPIPQASGAGTCALRPERSPAEGWPTEFDPAFTPPSPSAPPILPP